MNEINEINEKTRISFELKVVIGAFLAALIYIYQVKNDVNANTEMIKTHTEIIRSLNETSNNQQMDITKLTGQLNAIKDNTDELKTDVKYLIRKTDDK